MLGKYKGPSLGSINSICRQIAKGVQHLHLLKIVHGDIKPSNILISIPKGALGPQLKLSDFGLCHAFRNEFGSEESSFRPAFTNGWMCPSDYQVDQEGNRNSSFDIFPLGLVLGFTASNGVYPFGTDLKEAIECMENQQPMTLAPQQIDESIQSASFLDLLGKMLDYDATKRPTASEIPDHPFFKKQPIIPFHLKEKIAHQLPHPSTSSIRLSTGEAPAKKFRSDGRSHQQIMAHERSKQIDHRYVFKFIYLKFICFNKIIYFLFLYYCITTASRIILNLWEVKRLAFLNSGYRLLSNLLLGMNCSLAGKDKREKVVKFFKCSIMSQF